MMLIVPEAPALISLGENPRDVTLMIWPGSAWIVKLPFSSEATACFVPFTIIAAPGIGLPVPCTVTVPEIFRPPPPAEGFCACAGIANAQTAIITHISRYDLPV